MLLEGELTSNSLRLILLSSLVISRLLGRSSSLVAIVVPLTSLTTAFAVTTTVVIATFASSFLDEGIFLIAMNLRLARESLTSSMLIWHLIDCLRAILVRRVLALLTFVRCIVYRGTATLLVALSLAI